MVRIFRKWFIEGLRHQLGNRTPRHAGGSSDPPKIRPLMAEGLTQGRGHAQKTEERPDCSAILDFTLGGIRFQRDKMAVRWKTTAKPWKNSQFRRTWRNLGLIHVATTNTTTAIQRVYPDDRTQRRRRLFVRTARIRLRRQTGLSGRFQAAYRNAPLLQPENTDGRLAHHRHAFKQQKFEDAVTLLEVLVRRYRKTDF